MIFFPFYLYRMSNIFINPWIGIFVLGTDIDVSSDEVSLANPKLYHPGLSHSHFTIRSYWKWFMFGVWHSASIYLLWQNYLGYATDESGKGTDHWYMSMCIFFSIQLIIEFKLILELKRIDVFFAFWACLFVILLLFIPFLFSLSFMWHLDYGMEGIIVAIWTSPTKIIMIVAIPMIALIPDIIMKTYAALLWPTLSHRINTK